MTFPIIGIPCTTDQSSRLHQLPIHAVQKSYIEAIARAGGTPVLIPAGLSVDALNPIVSRIDGLLLTGGEDVSPHFYGAERHPLVKRVNEERDDTELWLTRWALAHDLPLFAICRGIQVLNVAAGGTLYQDLGSEYPDSIQHDRYYPAHPRDELAHSVRVQEDSRLYTLLGSDEVMVNTRHHQAVRTLGDGLTATAWAPDGVIEGTEMPDRRFVVAVQWHPENMTVVAPAMLALFRGFVDAAGE